MTLHIHLLWLFSESYSRLGHLHLSFHSFLILFFIVDLLFFSSSFRTLDFHFILTCTSPHLHCTSSLFTWKELVKRCEYCSCGNAHLISVVSRAVLRRSLYSKHWRGHIRLYIIIKTGVLYISEGYKVFCSWELGGWWGRPMEISHWWGWKPQKFKLKFLQP